MTGILAKAVKKVRPDSSVPLFALGPSHGTREGDIGLDRVTCVTAILCVCQIDYNLNSTTTFFFHAQL